VGAFHHKAEDHLPAAGDRVAAGAKIAEIDVLGIRNPVVAPIDGVLAALLVEDEAPVEYGQPVAVIRPQSSAEASSDSDGEA
jgi:acetyl-CoA carboxylase biotin carboxyl carrier protein